MCWYALEERKESTKIVEKHQTNFAEFSFPYLQDDPPRIILSYVKAKHVILYDLVPPPLIFFRF